MLLFYLLCDVFFGGKMVIFSDLCCVNLDFCLGLSGVYINIIWKF